METLLLHFHREGNSKKSLEFIFSIVETSPLTGRRPSQGFYIFNFRSGFDTSRLSLRAALTVVQLANACRTFSLCTATIYYQKIVTSLSRHLK
jgi:hypothetical protein